VYFRSELPKTNVGKILRRALRDELTSHALRATVNGADAAPSEGGSLREQKPR
jgi:hypothetical protein